MRGIAHWVVRGLPAVDAVLQAVLLALLFPRSTNGAAELVICLLIIPLSQHFLRGFGVYDSHRMEGIGDVTRKVFAGQLLTFFICLGPAAGLHFIGSPAHIVLFFALTTTALIVEKGFLYVALNRLRRHGFDRRNVCVIGSWEKAAEFSRSFRSKPEWGLEVVCIGAGGLGSRKYSGFPSGAALPETFEEVLKRCVIDEVLIAVKPEELASESQSVHLYEQYGLLVRVVLQPDDAGRQTPRVEEFFGATSMARVPAPWTDNAVASKRAFDLIIASLLLLTTAPLMLLIAALIKLSSPGPALFRQVRVGMNGRRFQMLKFRTMVDGAETLIRHSRNSITQGPIFKDPTDYRVTSLGRYLRRLSLDELPQLINVIRGDMSMVGPRPLPVDEADQIRGESRRRFSVLPGITCLWQINGRSNVNYEAWMKYDLEYLDKWSIWFDAVLLIQTVPAVLSRRGAY